MPLRGSVSARIRELHAAHPDWAWARIEAAAIHSYERDTGKVVGKKRGKGKGKT